MLPRAILIVVVAFVSAPVTAPVATADAPTTAPDDCATGADAPNERRYAVPIAGSVDCEGTISQGDVEDWFTFNAYDGDTYRIDLLKINITRMIVCLWGHTDRDSEPHACQDAFPGDNAINMTVNITQTGKWDLLVFGFSPGAYILSADLTAPPEDDCYTGADAADSPSTASRIRPPMSNCDPQLTPGDTDWYSFRALKGEPISVSIQSSPGLPARACLYAPNATSATSCTIRGGAQQVTLNATSSGDWLIAIDASGDEGRYTMSVYVDVHRGLGNNHAQMQHLACVQETLFRVACELRASDDEPTLIYDIFWGDGKGNTVTAPPGRTQRWTHTYTTPGEYRILADVIDSDLKLVPLVQPQELTRTVRIGSTDPYIHRADWTFVPAPPASRAIPTGDVPNPGSQEIQVAETLVPLPRKLEAGHSVEVSWSGAGALFVQILDSQLNSIGTCAIALQGTNTCVLPAGSRLLRAESGAGAPGNLSLRAT